MSQRLAGRKQEPGDCFPFPNGFSSRVGDDLSELVWENGHVAVQGQCSQVSRAAPNVNGLPSVVQNDAIEGLRLGGAAPYVNSLPSVVQNDAIEGPKLDILHDISTVLPSTGLDSSLNNVLDDWLDYPFDDVIEQDYGSNRLPEVSLVMENGSSKQNGTESALTNLDCGAKEPSFSCKPVVQYPWQNRQVTGCSGSGVVDNQMEFVFRNDNQSKDTYSEFRHRKSSSKLVNFPQFLKPNVANLHIADGTSPSGRSNNEKNDTCIRISPAPQAVPNSIQLSKAAHNEDLLKETANLRLQGCEDLGKEIPRIERPVDTKVACSSVGSGHGADASFDQTNHCKGKSYDADDSGSHSNDVDIDYVGEKKNVLPRQSSVSKSSHVVEVDKEHAEKKKPRKGTKRTRVAEVHNLSERRRRDRINEKMKALQELIPNCNKTDKASMLNEAIEYLKMLQFQVQLMSMGGGLCMQPMMFPQGVQSMYPHMAPLGVGIGPGFCPPSIFPPKIPQVPPHFASAVSGLPNMFTVNGHSVPVYGHPCQGPQRPEQRPYSVATTSMQTAPSCRNKKSSSSVVLNPAKRNTETSSQLTSAAIARHQSHQSEVMDQSTQVVDPISSHITN